MRAQLISDSYSLSQANLIEPEHPLNIAKYLKNEPEFLPWNVFLNRIRFYIDMLDTSSVKENLFSLLRDLVKSYYIKLDWNDNKQDLWLDRYANANYT
jgi:hypothetical protein